ncbi:MAG: pimeloyl-ACP methyl ester esterase BioH [Nevskiaceae bacterium]|jgi:pimeloyl-[acyl-carrier protein] methyl ester esterase|nr:pimeloyl-ACP methyl ester esterase BioH [Nevskiaceae bacterium]
MISPPPIQQLYLEAPAPGDLPVICLHGWGMNLRVFDSIREVMEHADTKTGAVDLPGHGRSPWNSKRREFAQQLQDVLSVLPPRCVLLGWSLGGQFALEIARVAPWRVAGLVLFATTPRFGKSPDWEHGLDPLALQAFRDTLNWDWEQTLADFVWLQLRGSRHAEQAQQQIRAALEKHGLPNRQALEAGLSILAANDLRRHIPTLTHPALLLAGQNDRITPPGAMRFMHEQMPRSRYLQIDRAGHAPFLSHTEECAQPLRDFLHDVAEQVR